MRKRKEKEDNAENSSNQEELQEKSDSQEKFPHDEAKDEEIEKLRQEKIRLLADIENEKKSHLREIEHSLKYSNKRLLLKVLPLLQNYEMALKVAEKIDNDEVNKFLSGLKMSLNDIKLALTNEGVKEYFPISKKDVWDSRFCEVVKEIEDGNYENGTILEVFQKGYFLHERILITAKVSISKNSVRN